MCTTKTCLDCRLDKWKNGTTDYLYNSEEWDEWENENKSDLQELKNKYSFDKGVS